MSRALCALLLVLFVPALSTAEELKDAPLVCACLQSETFVMGGVLLSGKQPASRIFEGIGVHLHWSCDRDAILIRLAAHVPRHFRKGTLAYALPFARNGVRITLFYDRLEPILEDHLALAGSIFGHILAHEIGHVLRRIDSHGETGLMRGHWNETDFASMKVHAFGFAPEDAQSIRESIVRDFEPVE